MNGDIILKITIFIFKCCISSRKNDLFNFSSDFLTVVLLKVGHCKKSDIFVYSESFALMAFHPELNDLVQGDLRSVWGWN